MRKWVVVAIFVQTTLSAQFWLAGEALLLRPTIYRPYTAISAPPRFGPPVGGCWVGKTKPGYNWGYLIDLGYRRCTYDARINWTSWIHADLFSLDAGDNEAIWLTLIHPISGDNFLSPGALRRRDQYRVQMIDGEAGYSFTNFCSPWLVRPYAGVRYAHVRYNVNIDALGIGLVGQGSITDRWQSDAQGTGPRGGVEIGFALPWSFCLSGDASLAFLLGTTKGRYLNFEEFIVDSFPIGDRMTPANLMMLSSDLRVGLGCCRAVGSFLVDLKVGYQISYLSMSVLRAQFYDMFGVGVSSVTRDPFALDGWSFRLGVQY